MSAGRNSIHIGTSGWHYGHWRGPFYPDGLGADRFLASYAARFPTVEINNSFYRLPSERALETWRDTVPSGFIFAVKGSRFITHLKKGHRAGKRSVSRLSHHSWAKPWPPGAAKAGRSSAASTKMKRATPPRTTLRCQSS